MPKTTEREETLRRVADQLYKDKHIEALGKQLGFNLASVRRYIKSNHKDDIISDRGTLLMLRDWSEGVSSEDFKNELRGALHRASLKSTADKCVPLTRTNSMASQVNSVELGWHVGLFFFHF